MGIEAPREGAVHVLCRCLLLSCECVKALETKAERCLKQKTRAHVTRSISCGAQLEDDTSRCLPFFILTTDVTVCSCCSWCERKEDDRGSSSKSRESCFALHREPQAGQSRCPRCCHPPWLAQVTEALLLGEGAENVMTQSETDANLEVKHEEKL